MKIPFNQPYMTGKELEYIAEAHKRGRLAGDGVFTEKCHNWLQDQLGTPRALLTPSCTAALEMAALLIDIEPGDEVIMPSYTFVSTANAFVLRGAVPVFVDIRSDTLNIDEKKIEEAITERTKAIVVVHYAGVSCEMDQVISIARRHGLFVIEDAAQGFMSSYKDRPLGTIGDLGCYSFHETKNITSGQGGALLVNNPSFIEHAEIIREKGTNRSKFFRGEVDKYSWLAAGSSYLPGEVTAAFLWAQLEKASLITKQRRLIWETYHLQLKSIEGSGKIRLPIVPKDCTHNGHMYYVLSRSLQHRTMLMASLREHGIFAVFHYVPLHSSPAGSKYSKSSVQLAETERLSDCLLRLPLWPGLEACQQRVIDALQQLA